MGEIVIEGWRVTRGSYQLSISTAWVGGWAREQSFFFIYLYAEVYLFAVTVERGEKRIELFICRPLYRAVCTPAHTNQRHTRTMRNGPVVQQ